MFSKSVTSIILLVLSLTEKFVRFSLGHRWPIFRFDPLVSSFDQKSRRGDPYSGNPHNVVSRRASKIPSEGTYMFFGRLPHCPENRIQEIRPKLQEEKSTWSLTLTLTLSATQTPNSIPTPVHSGHKKAVGPDQSLKEPRGRIWSR